MAFGDEIKFNHEIFVCINFLHLYNKGVHFLKHGNPNIREPDCICSKNTSIEIVGIYDSEQQAQAIWNNDLDIKTENKFSFNSLSFENLNNNILKKLEKLNNGLYDGFDGKKILVCDILSPSVTDKDVGLYIKSYIPFRDNDQNYDRYFDEIWILWMSSENKRFMIKKLE